MDNEQSRAWASKFGREYTDRNPKTTAELDAFYLEQYGVTRRMLNEEFIGDLDRDIKILEVGSNVGVQLSMLQEMGFKYLYGIELSNYAVELSKQFTKHINIIQDSAFDIPFQDGYFDVVFTSGLLIHIAPEYLVTAMDEMHRCSKRYIWGMEYYASQLARVPYRGRNNMLWKGNYPIIFQRWITRLELVKQRLIPYKGSDNVDIMYLLRKDGE